MQQNPPRKPRRTANACIPCRQSKIKCSGQDPCTNCQRRIVRCRFADDGEKVTISERYLQQLQRQAQQQQQQQRQRHQSQSQDYTRPSTTSPPGSTGVGLLSPMSQQAHTVPTTSARPYSSHHHAHAPPLHPPMVLDHAFDPQLPPPVPPAPRYRQDGPRKHVPAPKLSPSAMFGSDELTLLDVPTTLAGVPSAVEDSMSPQNFHQQNHQTHLFPPTQEIGLSVQTSPFTTTPTTVKQAGQERLGWIWLAPSSTWSFTARLTLLLADKLQIPSPPSLLSSTWGDAYHLKWQAFPDDATPDMSGLPSLDHAKYLFSTVKFHLGQHYRLFDDETFLRQIDDFYSASNAEKVAVSRLWFAQFLLVVAFGNAFLSRSRNPREPPGAKYFLRAMSILPDLAGLWRDGLLAIEVMALAGLYLYSVDLRESANVYVGQAIRIAHLEGLHTNLPEEELGTKTVARCRDLWWTLYIMDQIFSRSLGIPTSIADSVIETLPCATTTTSEEVGGTAVAAMMSQDDALFCLQVKLLHRLSVIVNTIYKTTKVDLGEFLGAIRSILHTMAGHAQHIERVISIQFQNSVDTMSKGTRHITLQYHECVIAATRPLLLSVLHQRLDKLGRGSGEDDWQNSFALITPLIMTGIKSAAKTLEILSHEESLLEAFLPFDLEFLYGAALQMMMAATLFPDEADGPLCTRMAHNVLDEMISKGSRVAEVRKAALTRLERLFRELTVQSEERGLRVLSLAGTATMGGGPPGEEEQQQEGNGDGGGVNEGGNMIGPMQQQQQQQHMEQAQESITVGGTTPTQMQSIEMMAGLTTGEQHQHQHQHQHQQQAPPGSSTTSGFDTNSNIDSMSMAFLDDIGISSGEFFQLVDRIGTEDMF